MRTFVHVFDQCAQNCFSVASMIEHVLTQLKESHPRIKEAFLRSDNAGCYHCGPLMLAIPGISRRVGVTIRRYDFSDPQSGKDICDRRIATMKSHMRRYLNEGNNINSASDMKRALDSYGGVKGCRVAVVSVDKQTRYNTTQVDGNPILQQLQVSTAGGKSMASLQYWQGKANTYPRTEKDGQPSRKDWFGCT